MASFAASAFAMSGPRSPDIAPPSPATDLPQLVEAARKGVVSAQSTLFRRPAQLMTDIAFRLLPWGSEADDVVQDSFIIAMKRLDQLTNPAAFRAWLRTIVVRTANKRLRRRRLAQRLGLLAKQAVDFDALLSHGPPPDVAADLRAVYRRIEDLPAEPRVALILRKVEGLSIPEIAEAMGKSEGTVKRRLRVAEDLVARDLRPSADSEVRR